MPRHNRLLAILFRKVSRNAGLKVVTPLLPKWLPVYLDGGHGALVVGLGIRTHVALVAMARGLLKTTLTTPTPQYLQKSMPPKYAIQWGCVWHTSPLKSRDFYRNCGIRTPKMACQPPLFQAVLQGVAFMGLQVLR